jgi:hypothetical protein
MMDERIFEQFLPNFSDLICSSENVTISAIQAAHVPDVRSSK